jgi:N,N'-diacetyllegionaminate synthase
MNDIKSALDVLVLNGTKKNMISVLHCSTEYPTPMHEVNLKAMLAIKDKFDVQIGYSDHTEGIEVSIAAVAMGANIIEKHITLNKNSDGPDHSASTEPEEFKKMVCSIRNIEVSLGDGIKAPTKSEQKNMLVARKSIVAAKEIKKDEILTEENLSVKRPGSGISPMQLDTVIGTPAIKNFTKDEMIVVNKN